MKILLLICGIFLVTLAVQGRPACEECAEEAPLAVPDENVLKVVKLPLVKSEQGFEEAANENKIDPVNIIDAPVVCPEGQKPDHNGKCRPVWSG